MTTDYGHDLLFGTFVTPTNHPAHQAVEQAVVADEAGLDLVTFQDHPYVNRFHDTLTLLSYAAARTERIKLSGNVFSSPLRPPAVLARAHASLDRLTGGRIELALGAVPALPQVLDPDGTSGTTASGAVVAAGTGDNMAAALGLGLGTVFGVSLVQALGDMGISELVVPSVQLVGFLLLGAVIGVVAATFPARRAGRLKVLDAIATA